MVVNLDTERLQEMSRLLQQANNNIDRATELLRSISTHQNWSCKERYTINDYILDNRTKAVKLQEDCERFCAVTKQVADEFVETESGIAQLFPGVESAIAAILANPVASVIVNQKSIRVSSISARGTDLFSRLGNLNSGTKVFKGLDLGSGLANIAKQVLKGSSWSNTPIQRVSLKGINIGGK